MLSDEEKKAIEFVKSELQDEKIARNDYQSLSGLYGNLEIEIVLNIIEKQSKEIEELKDMNERQKYRIELVSEDKIEERGDSIDESTMLKQIKSKLDKKNIPIETLLAEFERLEDLEDDLTTVYLNGVYDGEKKVEDKIKAKIEEVNKEEKEQLKGTKGQDRYAIKQEYMYKRSVLQSLLEKE